MRICYEITTEETNTLGIASLVKITKKPYLLLSFAFLLLSFATILIEDFSISLDSVIYFFYSIFVLIYGYYISKSVSNKIFNLSNSSSVPLSEVLEGNEAYKDLSEIEKSKLTDISFINLNDEILTLGKKFTSVSYEVSSISKVKIIGDYIEISVSLNYQLYVPTRIFKDEAELNLFVDSLKNKVTKKFIETDANNINISDTIYKSNRSNRLNKSSKSNCTDNSNGSVKQLCSLRSSSFLDKPFTRPINYCNSDFELLGDFDVFLAPMTSFKISKLIFSALLFPTLLYFIPALFYFLSLENNSYKPIYVSIVIMVLLAVLISFFKKVLIPTDISKLSKKQFNLTKEKTNFLITKDFIILSYLNAITQIDKQIISKVYELGNLIVIEGSFHKLTIHKDSFATIEEQQAFIDTLNL